MICARLSLAVALLTGGAWAAELPPPGATACGGCHPAVAGTATPVPALAGRPAAEILAKFRDFRDGRAPATVMDRIAKGVDDQQADAIARWLAAR